MFSSWIFSSSIPHDVNTHNLARVRKAAENKRELCTMSWSIYETNQWMCFGSQGTPFSSCKIKGYSGSIIPAQQKAQGESSKKFNICFFFLWQTKRCFRKIHMFHLLLSDLQIHTQKKQQSATINHFESFVSTCRGRARHCKHSGTQPKPGGLQGRAIDKLEVKMCCVMWMTQNKSYFKKHKRFEAFD